MYSMYSSIRVGQRQQMNIAVHCTGMIIQHCNLNLSHKNREAIVKADVHMQNPM